MPIPAKFGTYNSGGGVSFQGDPTVIVNGRQSSRFGDMVTPHPYLHPANPIVLGSASVLVGLKPQGFLGSYDACGHVMLPVEADVLVGIN
jgi:uncharacterized Zn-binding protein involved in type VI secretion